MKTKQKAKAIEIMKQMDIYAPYIEGFEKENKPCYYEGFAGFWTYQDEELEKKIKSIEKEYGCIVYAVTHEYTDFGECYSMLIISKYQEEWDRSVVTHGRNHYAFAYVWNKTDDYCSEFGTVLVQSRYGGITRIG